MSAALGRRLYAGLAACSAGVHAALLGHAGGAVAAALLAVMIAACLWCAWHLWQRGTLAAWLTVALMSLAMLAVHTPMPAHHHAPAGAAPVPALMAAAMALAAVEVVIAGVVLYVRTRHRAALLTGTPDR
ncbi:hypothetical protein JRC04_22705 [Mycolicibacterium sp. S2-37]|uniref:hypothetical protein n=1 Tax=Mycolicibacterium sp. S2-37 TaxID=2810297 RepID=UPI001A944551|nr:hypothetical protein [Mycolicibacterium sp. S2-37]MBO0680286.1 hypothetical protein [Mycolicibacterium sp. S2-37]